MTWFRRDPALRIFPVLGAVLVGAVILSPGATWVGWWQRTAVVVHVAAVMVLGPIACSVAAWTTARARTRHFHQLDAGSARPMAAIGARRLIPLWVVVVLTYLALQSVAYVRTAMSASGSPTWPVLLLTIAVLTFAIAWGCVAGALLPRPLAAIVSPIALYVVMALPVYSEGGEETWGRLLPVIQQPVWDPELSASWPRLLLSSGWLLVATAGLLLLLPSKRGQPRPGCRVVVAVVAASLALGGWILTHPAEQAKAFVDARAVTRENHVCQSVGTGQVCVWRSNEDLLPVFAEAYRRLERAGPGLQGLPSQLVEAGLGNAYPHGLWFVHLTRHPSASEIAASMINSFMVSAPFECPRGAEVGLSGQTWEGLLARVLMTRGDLPQPAFVDVAPLGAVAVKQVLALPEQQQLAWLQAAQREYVACRPLPPIPVVGRK